MSINLILVVVLLAVVIALITLSRKAAASRRKLAELDAELTNDRNAHAAAEERWKAATASLEIRIAQLSKWQTVADADAKAAELLAAAQRQLEAAATEVATLRATAESEAQALLSNAKAEAEGALRRAKEVLERSEADVRAKQSEAQREIGEQQAKAQSEAIELTSNARQELKRAKEEARGLLDAATVQAREIAAAAERRANEIAGSAYEAMQNASLYEQTAKAIKNIIAGYGDEYIIPERSLLDGLAEEFAHTDAGVQLKRARERTNAMVRQQTAATCDYVEVSRRTTAINFVIDAFNGKVDSILSRVRNDNAGTLAQEIRDAFTLVNFNGKAFRDARITPEFLDARLAELNWAAIAQQLKLDEREEQRRIREQIREEEKARREYERAMREAAKDEEMLRKAMEKALQQVERATEAQKAKYEAQIQELGVRLREAEERSQRALSMAQQTKRGHVYIISNVGSFGDDVYKIGLTRRLEPLDRIRELGDSSVPFEFDVHALIFSDDAPALERQLHKHFLLSQMNKVNHRKEFFRVGIAQIKEEVTKLGLEAKWTMIAEAREYRETLAIEKVIAADPSKRAAWVDRQLELDPVTDTSDTEAAAAVA